MLRRCRRPLHGTGTRRRDPRGRLDCRGAHHSLSLRRLHRRRQSRNLRRPLRPEGLRREFRRARSQPPFRRMFDLRRGVAGRGRRGACRAPRRGQTGVRSSGDGGRHGRDRNSFHGRQSGRQRRAARGRLGAGQRSRQFLRLRNQPLGRRPAHRRGQAQERFLVDGRGRRFVRSCGVEPPVRRDRRRKAAHRTQRYARDGSRGRRSSAGAGQGGAAHVEFGGAVPQREGLRGGGGPARSRSARHRPCL